MKLDNKPCSSTEIQKTTISKDIVYDAAVKVFCMKGINEMSVSEIANNIAEELFPLKK